MQINRTIAVSDSGFIFNPGTGDSFSANPTGIEIIRLLKEDKSRQEVLDALEKKFTVDRNTLEKDLDDYLMMLRSYQILKEDA